LVGLLDCNMKAVPATTERRFLPSAPPVVKGRTVSGVAAKFNSRSENLGTADRPVFEIIAPGAFGGVLNDDVVSCFNHDESLILARSENGKGTLRLWVDGIGLNYEFTAPDTTAGNDLLESLNRGDIRGSSFAFQVAEGGDRFTQEPGGVLRTITKIGKLHDVSPVVRPAYKNTAVDARGLTGIQPVATPARNGWKRMFEFLK
jgi:HK97 family phage prohead protease